MSAVRAPAAPLAVPPFADPAMAARTAPIGPALHFVAQAMIEACGMLDLAADLRAHPDLLTAATAALRSGATVLCDCAMVHAAIDRTALPAGNPVVETLTHPDVPALAKRLGTTRSAAAVDLWGEQLAGAVVVVGNAPTTLFHLLERLDAGAPRPAAILGLPVGFVGAAESKALLASGHSGLPFFTVLGRRGGSALAATALNTIAASARG